MQDEKNPPRTGAAPGPEAGKDRILDHEFDGIREYDNRLPNWWLLILFGTIVFAVAYWINFQTFGTGKNPPQRYQVELARAAEAQLARMAGQEVTNESLTLMAGVPDRVAEGAKIFQQFCVICHADQGQGNVGPNLTDGYWIHGGSPLEIHHTVTNGVPEKGMVAWGNQLGPNRVQAVVAFVLTLKGKNVPGKEPQGVPEGTGAPGDDVPADGAPGAGAPGDSTGIDSTSVIRP